MTGLALALVLAAAFLHATWNFLFKRAKDKPSFVLLFGLASVVMYLPVFVFMAGRQPIPWEAWFAIGASGVVHALYFATLARGYSVGDLSLVYPLARGTGPLLVPVWAALFLGEHPSATGLAGILAVVGGVYILHLQELSWRGMLSPLLSVRTRATRAALLTGLLISVYTTVDKIGVTYAEPFVYMYLFSTLYTLLYAPFVLTTSGWAAVNTEWRLNARSILVVGFLVVFTYTMVLFAMTMSHVGYVAAAREFGVVVGAAMGTLLLKESYGRAKVGGAALIAIGIAMIALAGA
ncbi:MAG: DMT family transporter [Bacteroidetes bacterium]|nr:DMT family transporter [Bacteroidota bacterium]